ncbi:MAG: class I SAM-dependent methyltransferase [Candidatus Aminicenantes bacterium]|nr:class I SAM-dependent methyltransferase [Candidatus Aminicenantes bacterium]
MQDKSKEKAFFDRFSAVKEYDVFTPYGYRSIIEDYLKLIGSRVAKKGTPGETKQKFFGGSRGAIFQKSPPGRRRQEKIIDLGCGTGNFTRRFAASYEARFFGLDISQKSAALAARLDPGINYCAGDIEHCCFKKENFDIVLFSGVLHHFEDYETCLREGFRLLKKGGCMLSYDPNIKNPAMWLYRHPASPFFSKKGKTDNEQLLSVSQLALSLQKTGFTNIDVHGIGGVTFKYVESRVGRLLLPFYNLFEALLGLIPPAKKYGSFVIAYGEKA